MDQGSLFYNPIIITTPLIRARHTLRWSRPYSRSMQPVSTKTTEVPDSPATAVEQAAAKSSHALGRRSLELIGNTPLLRLERLTRDLPGIELLGKAEWYNPG